MSENFLKWIEYQKEYHILNNKEVDIDHDKGIISFRENDDVEIWNEEFSKKINLILETPEIKKLRRRIKTRNIYTYVRKNYMNKKLISNIFVFEINLNKIDFLISISEYFFNTQQDVVVDVMIKDKKSLIYEKNFDDLDEELLNYIKLFENKAKEIYLEQKKVKLKSLFKLVNISEDSKFNRSIQQFNGTTEEN